MSLFLFYRSHVNPKFDAKCLKLFSGVPQGRIEPVNHCFQLGPAGRPLKKSVCHHVTATQPFTMFSIFNRSYKTSICSRELLMRTSRSIGVARLGLKSVK